MGRGKLWTDAETEYLEEVFYRHHSSFAAKAYQDHARYKGWTRRTKKAILQKAERLFGSRNVNLDNYCLYQMAELLKLPKGRFYSWYRRGLLKTHKQGGFVKVTNEAMADFARANPRKLADADRDALLYLFESELTDYIKSFIPGKKLSVLHVPTLKVYPSIGDAAKATNYSYHAVRWHLNKYKSNKFRPINRVEFQRA